MYYTPLIYSLDHPLLDLSDFLRLQGCPYMTCMAWMMWWESVIERMMGGRVFHQKWIPSACTQLGMQNDSGSVWWTSMWKGRCCCSEWWLRLLLSFCILDKRYHHQLGTFYWGSDQWAKLSANLFNGFHCFPNCGRLNCTVRVVFGSMWSDTLYVNSNSRYKWVESPEPSLAHH